MGLQPAEVLVKTNGDLVSGYDMTSAIWRRRLFLALSAIVLIYAFLAGLRTISDPDSFWQLATGRWVAQHHRVFSTEVFSYTAQGQPWIYPVGSSLFLYWTYLIGGYALLSWVGALACAGTVALLLRRGSAATAAVAIVAVTIIAGRTAPRADMFTVVIFAAFLSLLWENYQTGKARLWLLPLLMIAWVNCHLGFVAGLGLIAAFVGIDLLEMLFAGDRRRGALERLRRAWPWYAGTALATLANPWGWGIYTALIRQNRAMALHSGWIAEWGRVPLTWAADTVILLVRNPRSSFYLLLAIAIAAAIIAILQRQFGFAILLFSAIYIGVEHVRMFAVAAGVIVVLGGAFLDLATKHIEVWFAYKRTLLALAFAMTIAFAALAGMRSYDVVRNRNHSASTFGAGPGWLPHRAMEFVQRENLPGEIFNTYNEGGYFLWMLGPERRDYLDGRAIPFGTDLFHHEAELMQSSLDSDRWKRESERYNINTIILPLNRFEGALAAVKIFCDSKKWATVYLDEVSAVFVRRTPRTEDLIRRTQVNCATAPLPAEAIVKSRAGAFNQWANAASVLAALGRNSEALAAADKAEAVSPGNSFVPWLKGTVYLTMDSRKDAEGEFAWAVHLEPKESLMWFSAATLYKREGYNDMAIVAQRLAINLASAPQPAEMLKLAQLYLAMHQPKPALEWFDKAERNAPPDLLATTGGNSFRYQIAMGRASAWRTLGDTNRANHFDQEAVKDLVPAKQQD
ncbi:MAG: tetratricopeptide repeat protein [Candidatus Korobacteraceae bacterium]